MNDTITYIYIQEIKFIKKEKEQMGTDKINCCGEERTRSASNGNLFTTIIYSVKRTSIPRFRREES